MENSLSTGPKKQAWTPQHSPLILKSATGKVVAGLKVDSFKSLGQKLELSGWLFGNIRIGLLLGKTELDSSMRRESRQDVAVAYSMIEPAEGFGFRLTASPKPTRTSAEKLLLRVGTQQANNSKIEWTEFPLSIAASSSGIEQPTVHFSIDGAVIHPETRELLIVGWTIHDSRTDLIVETDLGDRASLLTDAYRFHRSDVYQLYRSKYGPMSAEAGFISKVPGVAVQEKIRLIAQRGEVDKSLAEIPVAQLSNDPVSAASWLFGINSPVSDLHRRMSWLDVPWLETLMAQRSNELETLTVISRTLGEVPKNAKVAVIVPLYGRIDFVEHQIIEFTRDSWFKENVELIYVLDDQSLVEPFVSQAEDLFRLYKLPFRWIWGGGNRGFSGANNLGASQTDTPYLLFLNSDAFPRVPGWICNLLDALRKKDVGAVGPQLVYGDGSIQHAGMKFLYKGELGIWVNHHPNTGIDPQLGPLKFRTSVPAVTGACLLMRRTDFDLVGGWDTGYLIGDFEDSDLCLKLQSFGKAVVYVPDAILTHLERQSFTRIGADDFRQRVVIYNAVRHQQRWKKLICDWAA